MSILVSVALSYAELNLIISGLNITKYLAQAEEGSNMIAVSLIAGTDNTVFCIDNVCIWSRILCRRPVIVASTDSSTTYFNNSVINSIKPWHYKC